MANFFSFPRLFPFRGGEHFARCLCGAPNGQNHTVHLLFHIVSCINKNESTTVLEFLFEVDDEKNRADFIIAVMGDGIQSELRTLENLFFRVRLNLERA